jgi:hypothetical protein
LLSIDHRAAKKPPRKCEHGRQKGKCRDCGTGYCQHGPTKEKKCEHNRGKGQCKDCGTGHCQHGRMPDQCKCKDCGTGYCEHNRRKNSCRDCDTGYCEHNRRTCPCGPGAVQGHKDKVEHRDRKLEVRKTQPW